LSYRRIASPPGRRPNLNIANRYIIGAGRAAKPA
jgi:hypothetical protein